MTATAANLVVQGASLRQGPSYIGVNAEAFYEGQLLFLVAASGLVSGDDANGANVFAGVCRKEATGDAATRNVDTWDQGIFRHLTFTGTAAQATEGDPVFAVDNQTIQASATSASYCGRCREYISAASIALEIDVLNYDT